MQDLNSILDGDDDTQEAPQEAQAQEVEEVEQVEEVKAEAEEAPEAEAEPPKGEEVSEPPALENEERMVPQAALLDERRKRQELEAKLNAEPKKAPDIFDDQEAYTKHISETVSQQVLNERANISEFLARREYKDLDAKVAKFQEMAATNPTLQQQVMAATSPYHELYDIVSKSEELDKMKDVGSYKAQLRAEVEAEIKAEYEAKAKTSQSIRESIPPSLNDVGSKGSLKGHDWSGPTSLDSILN